MWAKLDRNIVWESNDVMLLGIILDNNLKFDKHVSNICSKANTKLSALTRVAKVFPFKKRRILFKRKIHYPFKWIQLNGNVKIGKCILKNRTIFHLIVEKLDVFNFLPIFFYCYH